MLFVSLTGLNTKGALDPLREIFIRIPVIRILLSFFFFNIEEKEFHMMEKAMCFFNTRL